MKIQDFQRFFYHPSVFRWVNTILAAYFWHGSFPELQLFSAVQRGSSSWLSAKGNEMEACKPGVKAYREYWGMVLEQRGSLGNTVCNQEPYFMMWSVCILQQILTSWHFCCFLMYSDLSTITTEMMRLCSHFAVTFHQPYHLVVKGGISRLRGSSLFL